MEWNELVKSRELLVQSRHWKHLDRYAKCIQGLTVKISVKTQNCTFSDGFRG